MKKTHVFKEEVLGCYSSLIIPCLKINALLHYFLFGGTGDLHLSYTPSPCLLRWGLANFSPGLVSDFGPPHLCLPK
jgi:hypothetical protein